MAVLNYFSDKNNEFFNDHYFLKEDDVMPMDCMDSVNEFISSLDTFLPDISSDNSDNLFQGLTDFKSEDFYATDLNTYDHIPNFLDENFNQNQIISNDEEIVDCNEFLSLSNFMPSENIALSDSHSYINGINFINKKPEVIVMKKSENLQNLSYLKYKTKLDTNFRKNEPTISHQYKNYPIQYTKSVLLRSQNKNYIQPNMKNKSLNDKYSFVQNIATARDNNENTFSQILNIRKRNLELAFPQKSNGINFISKRLNLQKITNVTLTCRPKTLIVKKLSSSYNNNKTILPKKLDNSKLFKSKTKDANFKNFMPNINQINFENLQNEATNDINLGIKLNEKYLMKQNDDLFIKDTRKDIHINVDNYQSNIVNSNKDIEIDFSNLEKKKEILVKVIKNKEKSTEIKEKDSKYETNSNHLRIIDDAFKIKEVINIANEIITKEIKEYDTNNVEMNGDEYSRKEYKKNQIDYPEIFDGNNLKYEDPLNVSGILIDDKTNKLVEDNIMNDSTIEDCPIKLDSLINSSIFCNKNFIDDATYNIQEIIEKSKSGNFDESNKDNVLNNCDNAMTDEILDLMQEAEIQFVVEENFGPDIYEDILNIGSQIEIHDLTIINQNEISLNTIEADNKPKKKLSLDDYKNLSKNRKIVDNNSIKSIDTQFIEMYDYSFTEDHTYSCLYKVIKSELTVKSEPINTDLIDIKEEMKTNEEINNKVETKPILIDYNVPSINDCKTPFWDETNSLVKTDELKPNVADSLIQNTNSNIFTVKNFKRNTLNKEIYDSQNFNQLNKKDNIKTTENKIFLDNFRSGKFTKPSLKSQMLMEISLKKKLQESKERYAVDRINIVPSPNYSDQLSNYSYDDLSSISSCSDSEELGSSGCVNRLMKKRNISEESQFSRSSSISYNSNINNGQNTRIYYSKPKSHFKAVNERRIVYVGNIPNSYTKYDLERNLKCFGRILDSSVHFKKNKGKFGFVTYSKSSEAEDARKKGHLIPGCKNFDFNYGGRRDFCQYAYMDLDDDRDTYESSENTKMNSDTSDFQNLLYDTLKMLKKRK